MNRWARVRWWGKWSILTLYLLLFVCWIASAWFGVSRTFSSGWALALSRGAIVYAEFDDLRRLPPSDYRTYVYRQRPSGFQGYMRFDYVGGGLQVCYPIWPAIVVGGLAWGGVWLHHRRARRRAMVNHCPKCGYDLAGLNAGAACPECGSNK